MMLMRILLNIMTIGISLSAGRERNIITRY